MRIGDCCLSFCSLDEQGKTKSQTPPCALGDRLCGADADCMGGAGSMASGAAAGCSIDHPCAVGGRGAVNGGGADRPAQPQVMQSHSSGVRKRRRYPGGVVEYPQPSHHRLWADDVAQLLEARIDGDDVQLKNVRNFEWRSETDYTPRWESRTYDLTRLRNADLVLFLLDGDAHRSHAGVVRLRRW